MDKKSVTQFYQAPVRFLAESVNRESEFEKPYVDDSYRPMHFDFPWPDWPPMPDIPPWPPLPPFDGPVPGLPGCAITCYPPHNGCDNPVWCHPSIWCGVDIGCALCTWTVEGAISGYTPHGKNWGIDIWIDEELIESGGKALVRACMTDPCGNVCCEDIEVSCCPAEVAISWDKNKSGTLVARNNAVNLYVKDGFGPYTWSVTGTDFSLESEVTVGVTNILTAGATACGTAVITVTDICGIVTTGCVRCSTGFWDLVSSCNQNGGDKSELTNQSRILLTEGDCPDFARKEEFWGECCNPDVCGSDTSCCSYFWNDYCPYCQTQTYYPLLTRVKGVGEYSDWKCSP